MSDFGDELGSWGQKTLQRLELAKKKIALEALSRVVLRSPVLTGRFRGNWQVGLGDIPNGVVAAEDKNGTSTIASGEAAIDRSELETVIYIINNLPYAQRLEYGWSSQAPNGMVRLTVQELQPIVDQVIQQLQNGS